MIVSYDGSRSYNTVRDHLNYAMSLFRPELDKAAHAAAVRAVQVDISLTPR